MLSDHARRELSVALGEHLGPGPADTLLELLHSAGLSDLARQSDIVAVRGEIAGVWGEIAGLRGELAELRGELRAQVPRLVAANIGSMMGIAGLVFVVAKMG
jgi:hypothetical protein